LLLTFLRLPPRLGHQVAWPMLKQEKEICSAFRKAMRTVEASGPKLALLVANGKSIVICVVLVFKLSSYYSMG